MITENKIYQQKIEAHFDELVQVFNNRYDKSWNSNAIEKILSYCTTKDSRPIRPFLRQLLPDLASEPSVMYEFEDTYAAYFLEVAIQRGDHRIFVIYCQSIPRLLSLYTPHNDSVGLFLVDNFQYKMLALASHTSTDKEFEIDIRDFVIHIYIAIEKERLSQTNEFAAGFAESVINTILTAVDLGYVNIKKLMDKHLFYFEEESVTIFTEHLTDITEIKGDLSVFWKAMRDHGRKVLEAILAKGVSIPQFARMYRDLIQMGEEKNLSGIVPARNAKSPPI